MTSNPVTIPLESKPAYNIEAIVSIDERGQMVLPKELRQRAGIKAGDKLALVAFEDKGEICCISFFKVQDLSGMVRDKLSPLMQGALTHG